MSSSKSKLESKSPSSCSIVIISSMNSNSMLSLTIPIVSKGIDITKIDTDNIIKGIKIYKEKGLRKLQNSPKDENSLIKKTEFGDMILNFKINIPNGNELDNQDKEDLSKILNKIN